jgi:hypothetical protein
MNISIQAGEFIEGVTTPRCYSDAKTTVREFERYSPPDA